ncbi:MAG: sulfur carrier protein ThiS [Candidatus Cloacimonetes bacterium]|nr:sulfur carrier protein ThiS [Candidatus Cloacimonadota bacterium]
MKTTVIVNGNKLEWFAGMTIGDVLEKMNYTFRMLVIRVNGELVRKQNYATHEVPSGADIKVIHLISGG